MEKKSFNREWVKTAAIICLAVLLVLTFFSNTILNSTLTEVSVAEVESNSITAKVKGTGTVSSIGQTEVKASSTRYIAQVNAKEGKEVEAGEVLFTLGAGDSEELEAAKEKLETYSDNLLRSYSYVSDGSVVTASTSVNQAQEALKRAQQKEEDAQNKLYSLAVGDEEVTAAENRLKQAENNLAIVIKNWSPSLSQAELTFNKTTEEATSLYSTYNEAQITYDDKLTIYNMMSSNPEQYSEAEIAKAKEDVEIASTALTTASTNYITKKGEVETARAIYEKEQNKANAAEDSALKELSAAQDAYDAVMSSYNSAYTEYENAVNNRIAAENTYQSALDSYYSAVSSYNATMNSNNISASIAQREYERQKEKVEELSGDTGTTIVAPISGTVSSISCSPGGKVSKDQVLCVIDVPDMGYELSYSVTNDQAKRIKVGNSASVSNYYWGDEIIATVSSIKVDPKNPQTNKLITFTLEGDDISNGSQLTVSVGEKSATYDYVVPNSAVRNDSNGTFVLVIESKNNALGNRYFAKRVAAEVLASDDNYSAISGNFSYGDFVITTSSSPIKSGDQVRMADTND